MNTQTPVLEMVHFRLMNGADRAQFLIDARATEPVLRRQPGYVSRRLVESEDGAWTDIVEWADLAQASEAAKAVMADPGFAPFASAIDMTTISMSHAALVWRMD